MIQTKKISAVGWMLFSAFCFAMMGAFTYSLKDTFDWRVTGFARSFINFLLIITLARVTGKPVIVRAPRTLWLRSIVGTLSIICTFFVFGRLPIAEATSLSNLMPIWMALLIGVTEKKTIPRTIMVSIALSVAGVFLIQDPHFDQTDIAIVVGIFQALLASIAVYNLHRIKNIHPTTIVTHFMGVASVITFVTMIPSLPVLLDGSKYTLPVVLALLGIGFTGTAAQLAMTRAYMLGNPAINSTVGLAQVVFAAIFDLLFWDRSFSMRTIMGIALITIPTTLFVARIQFRNRTQSI